MSTRCGNYPRCFNLRSQAASPAAINSTALEIKSKSSVLRLPVSESASTTGFDVLAVTRAEPFPPVEPPPLAALPETPAPVLVPVPETDESTGAITFDNLL